MPNIVNEVFQARLCVNYKETGISYTYWLKAATWQQARMDTIRLAEAHSWLLGAGAYVEWAEVRQPVYPAPVLGVLAKPMPALTKSNGTPYWDPPDNATTGLNVIWKPHDKKHYWRRLWYLPDSEVKDSEWVRRGLKIPATTPAIPRFLGNLLPDQLYVMAIGTIRDLTQLAVQIEDDPNGKHQWELSPFDRVTFGAIGSSSARPKFHRVSWEWYDWTTACHFSPCGCPVTAMRATYEAPAIGYKDGLLNHLRWYYATPGATLMPFPTIFSGYYGMVDVQNASKPGEITGATDWTPGLSWGNAPGIQPTGGPNAFLGLAAKPFDDSNPTPLNLRPLCDEPPMTPFNLRTDLSDASFIELITKEITFDVDDFDLLDDGDGKVLVRTKLPPSPPPPPPPAALQVINTTGDSYIPVTLMVVDETEGLRLDDYIAGVPKISLQPRQGTATVTTPDTVTLDPGDARSLSIGGGLLADATIHGIATKPPGTVLTVTNGGSFLLWFRPLSSLALSLERIHGGIGTGDVAIAYQQSITFINRGIQWDIVALPHYKPYTGPQATETAMPLWAYEDGRGSSVQLTSGPVYASMWTAYIDANLALRAAGSVAANVLNTDLGVYLMPFAGTTAYDGANFRRVGQFHLFWNTLATPITFLHNDAGRTANERFDCPNGQDYVVSPGGTLMFAHINNKWRLLVAPPGIHLAWNEVPTGAVNGTNDTFVLANPPESGKLALYVNSVKQREGAGNDFTIAGDTITFEPGAVPVTGDVIEAMYQY